LLRRKDRAGRALNSLFDKKDERVVSRSDLRALAKSGDLDLFVMATLLWGYPNGMQGSNTGDIATNLPALVDLLVEARQGISKWREHFAHVKDIRGVGHSTYTKLLTFLSVDVSGHRALIFDKRIGDVAASRVFEEFVERFTWRTYPAYLDQMYSIADRLKVEAENLEFFLYEFGLHLKETQLQ
jgi:hypothetical protein